MSSAPTAELSPELRAELLDPESWDKVLGTYARTMRLAVALTDSEGRVIGTVHNPQPVWSLVQDRRQEWSAGCLFCIAPRVPCTAVADSIRTEQPALVHDQAGLAHVAVPLSFGRQRLGALIAGQVFDRYPEALPLQRAARELGLPVQKLWEVARKQPPLSRATLRVYGDLLCTLGQAFLHQRYGAILERKLTETNRRFRHYAEAVVETVRQPLVILSDDLKIRSANQAFYDTFGVATEETEGRFLYDVGDRQWNITKLRDLLERVLTEKSHFQDFEVEHQFERIGLKIILFSGREIPQAEPYGQTILLSMEDITERRLAERQLVRSNADLQRFGYVISHDLQEPLRTVGSYTQLLAKRYLGKLDSDADEFIEFVQDGVVRMQAMIRDLLTYSQAANSEDRPLEAVSAAAALQEALWSLQAAIQESNASVIYSDLPTVPYDLRRLTQVFQNLVGNAIKYRREEQPQIRISAARREREWVFSVRDNGIGFEDQYKERIFGVFQRLHGPQYAGSGIGLATCQRIVERYGGRMWAESVPGEGSAFHFTLPVERN